MPGNEKRRCMASDDHSDNEKENMPPFHRLLFD